jgi:hypothetical protein
VRGRFDVLGAVLPIAGLVALVYGVSLAGDQGWNERLTIGLFSRCSRDTCESGK